MKGDVHPDRPNFDVSHDLCERRTVDIIMSYKHMHLPEIIDCSFNTERYAVVRDISIIWLLIACFRATTEEPGSSARFSFLAAFTRGHVRWNERVHLFHLHQLLIALVPSLLFGWGCLFAFQQSTRCLTSCISCM